MSHHVSSSYDRRNDRSSLRFHKKKRHGTSVNVVWLQQATELLLQEPLGTLVDKGKWHEAVSLLQAWSTLVKTQVQAAPRMEALLQRLIQESFRYNQQHHF
jgi:hypothetical protein